MDIEDIKVVANEHDLLTVFANLIENSVYWLQHMDDRDRIIEVSILREGQNTIVEYSDNGPGFQGNNVELMFEPGYSMKPEGTGLGLALAGEAMARIGGGIEAVNVENGAFFDIKFIGAN